MKKNTDFLKKLAILKYVIPVGIVTAAVGVSLFSYTAPSYEVQAEEVPTSSNNTDTKVSLPKQEELEKEDNSSKTAETLSEVEEPSTYKDGTYTGSAIGWGGTIKVSVTIKDNKMKDIQVLSASKETPSYFNRAKAVITAMLKAQSTNVDVVSGATFSSNGLIKAVRNALAKAAGDDTSKADKEESTNTNTNKNTNQNTSTKKKPSSSKENYDKNSTYKDGTFKGTAEGWGGDITLSVTIKDNKITKITILSASDETPEYFAQAKGVISSILKAQSTDVDTISGATYSSNGIIEAVKACLKQALLTPSKSDSEDTSNKDEGASSDTEQNKDQTDSSDSNNPKEDPSTKTYTYTENVVINEDYEDEDFNPYNSTFTITINNGLFESISYTADTNNANKSYMRSAYKGMSPRIVGQGKVDLKPYVDVVSGATYSSNGFIEAAKMALLQYQQEALGQISSTPLFIHYTN